MNASMNLRREVGEINEHCARIVTGVISPDQVTIPPGGRDFADHPETRSPIDPIVRGACEKDEGGRRRHRGGATERTETGREEAEESGKVEEGRGRGGAPKAGSTSRDTCP